MLGLYLLFIILYILLVCPAIGWLFNTKILGNFKKARSFVDWINKRGIHDLLVGYVLSVFAALFFAIVILINEGV